MTHRNLGGPYIYKRGAGNRRRVNHLSGFDRLGRFAGALCGSKLDFDTSCNLPLGRRTCKLCHRKWMELAQ